MKICQIKIRRIVILPKIHSVKFMIRRISVFTENLIRRINDPSNVTCLSLYMCARRNARACANISNLT